MIYSVVVGGYDEVPDDGRCILTGDDIMGLDLEDARRLSRHPKMLPHLYFPDVEYSIYIDGNIDLLVEPEGLVEKFLKWDTGWGSDWGVMKHAFRDCLYKEVETCLRYGIGDSGELREQADRYIEEGMPIGFGLWENPVIVRRHTEYNAEFGQMWWEEYMRGSERDQISFPYLVWREGLDFKEVDINIHDPSNGYFRRRLHSHEV